MTTGRARDAAFLAILCVLLGGWTGRRMLDTASDPLPAALDALRRHPDPEARPRAPSRRAVVALLDGLSRSRFRALLREGAFGPGELWETDLDVGSPSLSRPVYHAILTGVPQGFAGLGNNAHRGRARADTLPDRVRGAGGTVAWFLQTVPWFHDLAGAPQDVFVRGEGLSGALLDAQARGATLAVLHLTVIDDAGHAHGAASARYERAARDCARTVRELREALARTAPRDDAVWFVGADHGHLPQGGHGGPEPAVVHVTWAAFSALPAASVTRVEGVAPVETLAPTIARAMGVAPPRHALGAPLPFPGADDASRSLALAARRDAAERARRDVLRHNRAFGLARVGVGLLLVAVAFARRLSSLLVALGASLGFVVAHAPVLSLSAIVTHERFVVRSLLGITLAALPVLLLARRRGARDLDVLAASLVPPLLAWAYTLGSSGSVLPTGALALLLPASGLVPISVAGAWVVSWLPASLRAARARGS